MKVNDKVAPFLLRLLSATSEIAAISLVSLTPLLASPQQIGKTITWTATATDANAGPLIFWPNVTPPRDQLTKVTDLNVGTLSRGVRCQVDIHSEIP
jgi:hypothetical protein